MSRLTTNNEVSKMGMYELALNSCYIQDGLTRYRDFERDIDARDFARELMVAFGEWKKDGADTDNEIVDDDVFDDTMLDNLAHKPNTITGLIALFYRNLWVMSELREKLKEYEDAEEQGLLLKLLCKEVYASSGDIVYYIFDYEIVECINCGLSIDCDGKIWIALACDEHIFPYRSPIAEIDADPTDWCQNTTEVGVDEWGKSVFLTKEEAEQKLKEMESDK